MTLRLFCLSCTFEILSRRPPSFFWCVDRWGVNDLITSAYVLSAGEVSDKQERTLHYAKGWWPFNSSGTYAKISPLYCRVNRLEKVGGRARTVYHQYSHIYTYIFIHILAFVFLSCGLYQTKNVSTFLHVFLLHKFVDGNAYDLDLQIIGGSGAWCCKHLSDHIQYSREKRLE